MPQIVYCGPYDEVDVPAHRLRALAGEPVDVSDEAAASLLEQPDNWAAAGSDAAKAAAKRVADTAARLKADERAAKAAATSAAPTAGGEG